MKHEPVQLPLPFLECSDAANAVAITPVDPVVADAAQPRCTAPDCDCEGYGDCPDDWHGEVS